MRDFLVWYTNLDVEPFLEGLKRFSDVWAKKGIDVFHQVISMPGVSLLHGFANCREGAHFCLFGKKDADLYKCTRDNLVGGPSLVFHRLLDNVENPMEPDKVVPVTTLNGRKTVQSTDGTVHYLPLGVKTRHLHFPDGDWREVVDLDSPPLVGVQRVLRRVYSNASSLPTLIRPSLPCWVNRLNLI